MNSMLGREASSAAPHPTHYHLNLPLPGSVEKLSMKPVSGAKQVGTTVPTDNAMWPKPKYTQHWPWILYLCKNHQQANIYMVNYYECICYYASGLSLSIKNCSRLSAVLSSPDLCVIFTFSTHCCHLPTVYFMRVTLPPLFSLSYAPFNYNLCLTFLGNGLLFPDFPRLHKSQINFFPQPNSLRLQI